MKSSPQEKEPGRRECVSECGAIIGDITRTAEQAVTTNRSFTCRDGETLLYRPLGYVLDSLSTTRSKLNNHFTASLWDRHQPVLW